MYQSAGSSDSLDVLGLGVRVAAVDGLVRKGDLEVVITG